ncbi:aldehyde oxidoreductase molybdenum-binding subunit PaoC [Croceicoccus naphthovorans]|uniref:Xanthine dehydrogenase n=1 Tax=Croceicoccus naphthovorans TaxID=1348774 RepID=A0A0G3XE61_9SPHN|nr:aldehyde oxidoreductase molybdenum-binding subunit PaoC [Croceicoccus naphthovorans]AKM09487.1 xanthine dehydrogenase [Croceicoccus naphthovorans]MBB3991500.1 xanthine dehydrogenase YagR molybdenum-binding subunit [Croceicoccus naphthovorans]
MEFNAPAGTNLFDQAKVVGKSTPRIDGPLKVSGLAPYAFERHDVAENQAYGWVVGSGIAKGRIASMDVSEAKAAPGVIAIVTSPDVEPLGKGMMCYAPLFGGHEITHYHQAIACVVAETFEQARAAAALIRTEYETGDGAFDFPAAKTGAVLSDDPETFGDFDAAFPKAPVQIDSTYTTPAETHAMMEPHATIAAWEGDKLTLWTANQMIAWSKTAIAKILGIDAANVRLDSPYVGGGFGGKLWVRADAVLAALGAKAAGRPVKIALQRPMIANNTTHRQGTIQRLRIGAESNGKITAIAHENWSYNVKGGDGEAATAQTKKLYAGDNRLIAEYCARLDLPEGNAMRAPGEAPGHLGLEVAMDELAIALDMCPIELRILNEPDAVPGNPEKPFSDRNLVRCLRKGAERFGWSKRAAPATRREGRWLIGMGVAAGYRGSPTTESAARVKLLDGRIVVETDMTDIGTGSYTIIAQTAAETMGVPLSAVTVELGDSDFSASAGSGGQWGASSSTAGVYAACVNLRRQVGDKLGFNGDTATFADGKIIADNKRFDLADAGHLSAEDSASFGSSQKDHDVGTYAAHFCEVAVDAYTGETRLRRMLSVCDAGRILNPLSARSQVIGAMVMSVGMALMEELVVDKRHGLFINHDLAGYEVPVHADTPQQDVIFLDTLDEVVGPLKAKGVGELGICGPGAAIANAIYNATGIRVRDYPLTLDKYLSDLPTLD